MDLPVALKFRKEFVKGCSCKQAEYNPTQIEAANKRAEVEPTAPAAPAAPSGPPPQLDLDMGGDTPAAPAAPAAQAPAAPPAPEAVAPPPQAQAEPGQSSMVKKSAPPATAQ